MPRDKPFINTEELHAYDLEVLRNALDSAIGACRRQDTEVVDWIVSWRNEWEARIKYQRQAQMDCQRADDHYQTILRMGEEREDE